MIVIETDSNLHRVFDAAAWASGLLAGVLVARWRLKDTARKFPKRPGYVFALGAGAVLGAYLAGSLPALMRGEGALSHSVAGALAGAIFAVELYKLARGITISTGGVFVAPFVVGIVIGRWGCLYSGLADQTFGSPTSLPWGVDLGDGVARHPVQIYESLAMLAFLGAYLSGLQSRKNWALADGFYWMAGFYGTQRFLWEFLKPYPTLLGPFNVFHVISLGLLIYGWFFIARSRRPVRAS